MDIEDLFPLVSIEVSGVPHPVMLHAVREACRNWAQKTWGITETVNVPVAALDDSVSISLADTDSEILGVKYVFNTGSRVELEPYGDTEKLKNFGVEGDPRCYEFDGELKLYPAPKNDLSLAVTVATRPTKTAKVVNDKFYEHEVAISNFAKYRLMSMANQQWTNLEAAAVNYRQYKSLLSEEKLRELKGRTQANIVVKPRAFI